MASVTTACPEGLESISVDLGWVGALNERATFRFHDAVTQWLVSSIESHHTYMCLVRLGGACRGVACATRLPVMACCCYPTAAAVAPQLLLFLAVT